MAGLSGFVLQALSKVTCYLPCESSRRAMLEPHGALSTHPDPFAEAHSVAKLLPP